MGSNTGKKLVQRCDGLDKYEIEKTLLREFGLGVDMNDVDISDNAEIKHVESLDEEEREGVLNSMIAAPGLSLIQGRKLT